MQEKRKKSTSCRIQIINWTDLFGILAFEIDDGTPVCSASRKYTESHVCVFAVPHSIRAKCTPISKPCTSAYKTLAVDICWAHFISFIFFISPFQMHFNDILHLAEFETKRGTRYIYAISLDRTQCQRAVRCSCFRAAFRFLLLVFFLVSI